MLFIPELYRRKRSTSAAASGWTGGELSIGGRIVELQNVEITVPSTVDYLLPCYLEWVWHEGREEAERYVLGTGSVGYRYPFVIQGPILIEGPGKIMSSVYHHSTSHVHTLGMRHRRVLKSALY